LVYISVVLELILREDVHYSGARSSPSFHHQIEWK